MGNVLTAVPSRQRTEGTRITLPVRGILGGGESAESRPVRAAGYNAVVGIVVSDAPGTVTILAAPERRAGTRSRPGTFIPIKTIPTTLQGGVQAAQVDEEVRGDFVKVLYTNGATKQADFQFSVYLVPIFCFKRVDATVTNGAANPVPVSGTIVVSGQPQIQAVETTTPLAGGATFTGAAQDCINFESFGISVFISRLAADTNIDVIVENSSDGGVTFRQVDIVNLPVTPANPTRILNRVYSVTRQRYRVKLVNNTANALAATECISMRKPV